MGWDPACDKKRAWQAYHSQITDRRRIGETLTALLLQDILAGKALAFG
jgi:hypothetical protein